MNNFSENMKNKTDKTRCEKIKELEEFIRRIYTELDESKHIAKKIKK